MLFRYFPISWVYFVLGMSAFVTLMNFPLFSYLYADITFRENPFLFISLPFIFFGLVLSLFALFFLPYLSKALSILIVLSTCLSVFFMSSYGVIIDSDMIRNAVRTDAKEVADLLNAKLILFVLLLGILPALFIASARINYYPLKVHLKAKMLLLLVGLTLAFGFFLLQTKTLIPYFRTHHQARVYNAPFYQFYSIAKYFKADFSKPPVFLTFSEGARFKEESRAKRLLILVVGETARAANYSLDSYTRNHVNAHTEQEGVVYFKNFFSCGTSTAISLPCMFSLNARKDFLTSEYQENVLDILQNVGVRVVWLDNNYGFCQGVCARLKEVRQFDGGYDEVLLEEFAKEESFDGSVLYVLHLQGSHGPAYYKRYPEGFRQFTPTCDTNALSQCTEEEIFNTYDNTLYYTDWILKELITFAKAQTYEVALLYLSDHGESLGENGIYLHGMPYALAPKEQIHIPAIFYHNTPSIHAQLQGIAEATLSHDNLAHSLLGFFKIDSPHYQESYDIFLQK